jgi:hypothetical protein
MEKIERAKEREGETDRKKGRKKKNPQHRVLEKNQIQRNTFAAVCVPATTTLHTQHNIISIHTEVKKKYLLL